MSKPVMNGGKTPVWDPNDRYEFNVTSDQTEETLKMEVCNYRSL